MTDISYTIVRSSRKTIAIQILPSGEVLVRCPKRLPKRDIEAFVQSRRSWIEGHLEKLSGQPQLPPFTAQELQLLAEQARQAISERLAYFAPQVGVTFGRVTIRSQHTRWGSCSAKGNLNFNCLLMLCPGEVLDYVVVHELCHRKQLNHSAAFWAEVAQVMPDYRVPRAWLKEHGPGLIARLP